VGPWLELRHTSARLQWLWQVLLRLQQRWQLRGWRRWHHLLCWLLLLLVLVRQLNN